MSLHLEFPASHRTLFYQFICIILLYYIIYQFICIILYIIHMAAAPVIKRTMARQAEDSRWALLFLEGCSTEPVTSARMGHRSSTTTTIPGSKIVEIVRKGKGSK